MKWVSWLPLPREVAECNYVFTLWFTHGILWGPFLYCLGWSSLFISYGIQSTVLNLLMSTPLHPSISLRLMGHLATLCLDN